VADVFSTLWIMQLDGTVAYQLMEKRITMPATWHSPTFPARHWKTRYPSISLIATNGEWLRSKLGDWNKVHLQRWKTSRRHFDSTAVCVYKMIAMCGKWVHFYCPRLTCLSFGKGPQSSLQISGDYFERTGPCTTHQSKAVERASRAAGMPYCGSVKLSPNL